MKLFLEELERNANIFSNRFGFSTSDVLKQIFNKVLVTEGKP